MAQQRRIKLYTKTGDKGNTSLYDGTRAFKGDFIFDVLGTIDELNCHIGKLASYDSLSSDRKHELRIIQYRLINISSVIATPKNNKNIPDITTQDITELESMIDYCQMNSPPLKEFVLPGINPANCSAHLCRVNARKVERMVISLFHEKELTEVKRNILIWFNRLSDFSLH